MSETISAGRSTSASSLTTRIERNRTPRSLQTAATAEVSMSTTSAAYSRRSSAFSAAVRMIPSTVRSRPVLIGASPALGRAGPRRRSRSDALEVEDLVRHHDVVAGAGPGRARRRTRPRRSSGAGARRARARAAAAGRLAAHAGDDQRRRACPRIALDDRVPRPGVLADLRSAGRSGSRPRSTARRRCRRRPATGGGCRRPTPMPGWTVVSPSAVRRSFMRMPVPVR